MSSLLVESALRALLLASVASIGLRLFRVRNVLAQKCVWTVVLAASLAMPLLLLSARASAWPAATLRIPRLLPPRATAPAPSLPGARPALLHSSSPSSGIAASHAQLAPVLLSAPGRFPAPVISPDRTTDAPQPPLRSGAHLLVTLLWPVYLAVAGLFLLRLLNGLASVFLLWQASEPVSLHASLLAPGLRLRASDAVSSPVNVWAGVVLPAGYSTWDEKKLRIVLAHERSHVRQGDFYLQLFAGLYAALVWFSPLGWWLKRKLSDLGEAISDRAGLAEAASPFGYARLLLEFAAAPRPTLIGVAMARPSSLSRRMERLLNDSAFRQAFAGGRRLLLAALVAPTLIFTASAFVRVQAAPAQTQSPIAGQSHPDTAPVLDSPDAQPQSQPQSQPQTQPQPAPQPLAAAPVSSNAAASGSQAQSQTNTNSSDNTFTITNTPDGRNDSYGSGSSNSSADLYAYSYSGDQSGDAFALVLNNDSGISFSGIWDEKQRENIEHLRNTIKGSFLWFRHGGKSYIVTDPAIIQRLQAMYLPIQELGKQQEVLGRQQESLGKQQETLGKAQEEAKLSSPVSAEQMAKLKTEIAALEKQIDRDGYQVTIENLQSQLAELQSRIGAIQGEIARKQGAIAAQQGDLGAQQGQLGEEQGRLGEQQANLARELDRQVRSIIDQTLKNGTAQPAK